MITVKFPALNKALQKNVKDLDENDPRRAIIILNNNAIVLRDDFCIVCDLRDYFIIETGLEDDLDLEELDNILFYMDGKSFSNDYWSELIKGINIKVDKGNIYIENPKYAKDLHYKDSNLKYLEPLVQLQKASLFEKKAVDSISIPFGSLDAIYNCLKSEFKNDHIIFEFEAQERIIRFTFKNRKHFYGYIYPHYDSVQEGFKFSALESFIDSMSGFIETLKEEQKRMLAPLPPKE